MIQIFDKHNCCGCSACVQICPKQCIVLEEDEKGFMYPIVHKEHCINCGLCEKVCPFLIHGRNHYPIEVYAASNPDETVRMNSSSGGIFSMLAETILNENGVVFGACFDEKWNVIHDYTETKDGLEKFRGSKYVQSTIGDTYKKALVFLRNGRKVLFSGTPCQILGLKNFLKKEYENLLTVDVVCHGVPSPLVWRSYLEYVNPSNKKISFVNLRDKSRGWKNYSYLIKSKDEILVDEYASSSLYLLGFSLNLTLRPSCYKCPAKDLKSGSDVTLSDCWGNLKKNNIYDDDKGLSAVIVNSVKGKSFLDKIILNKKSLTFEFIQKNNPSVSNSTIEPYCSKTFWILFKEHGVKSIDIVRYKLKKNIFFRIYNKIRTKFIR